MGRCVSIYECDYLLNILSSNSLTQQSIRFLKLSQCDAGRISKDIPHVCCARNDDSLMFGPNAGEGLHDKSLTAPSAVNTVSSDENKDDSIIYKSSNTLLPKTNECGREKIENRIYSGQVSAARCLLLSWQIACFSFKNCFWTSRPKVKANKFFFLFYLRKYLPYRTPREKNFLGWRCLNIVKVRRKNFFFD
jgi:Regulatory CLIP domain of proteinases